MHYVSKLIHNFNWSTTLLRILNFIDTNFNEILNFVNTKFEFVCNYIKSLSTKRCISVMRGNRIYIEEGVHISNSTYEIDILNLFHVEVSLNQLKLMHIYDCFLD